MIIPIHRKMLYESKPLAIQILSEFLAKTTEQDVPYFVISITPLFCDDAELKPSKNLMDVLRLKFNDVENGSSAISSDQAYQIKDFVLKNLDKGIHSCIIHCSAGISRSAGVGAAISKAINGEDELFFEHYMPNLTCYKKVKEVFEK
jgi:predicted protein tyrosine phosphatase